MGIIITIKNIISYESSLALGIIYQLINSCLDLAPDPLVVLAVNPPACSESVRLFFEF